MPIEMPGIVATLGATAAALTLMLLVAAAVARRLATPAARGALRATALVVLLVAPLAGLVLPQLVTIRTSVPAVVGAGVGPAARVAQRVLETSAPTGGLRRAVQARHPLSRGLFLVWLAGVSAMLLRALMSFGALGVVRGRSRALDLPDDLLHELRSRSGVRRHFSVRICTAHSALGAMTWGVVRPTVLLPHAALTWPSGQRVAVLLHELAHVRRFDAVWRMLGLVATAAYWFNPLVWQLRSAMDADAELCADDAVLSGGVRATDYATVLLHLARTRQQRHAPLVPAFSGGALETRIARVVAAAPPRSTPSRALLAALMVIALSVCALAGTVRAEPISPHASNALFDVSLERRVTSLPAHFRRRLARVVRTSTPTAQRRLSLPPSRS